MENRTVSIFEMTVHFLYTEIVQFVPRIRREVREYKWVMGAHCGEPLSVGCPTLSAAVVHWKCGP